MNGLPSHTFMNVGPAKLDAILMNSMYPCSDCKRSGDCTLQKEVFMPGGPGNNFDCDSFQKKEPPWSVIMNAARSDIAHKTYRISIIILSTILCCFLLLPRDTMRAQQPTSSSDSVAMQSALTASQVIEIKRRLDLLEISSREQGESNAATRAVGGTILALITALGILGLLQKRATTK